tara:strand:+ start:1073 stop:1417 length:345 start_codon:yes stop_codon:yes gene_type:complete
VERVLNEAVIFEIDDFANVKLLNPNDFKEFCIQCSDTRSAIEICEILELVQQGNKVIDEKHLWLCNELVRELAPDANEENWEKGFTKMIDYATSNGWTENNGTLIRTHIEWAKV